VNAEQQQWKVTRAIINNAFDYPTDTATGDIKLYGNLYITNGYAQMYVNICSANGVACTGNIEFLKKSKITFANDYVAYLASGDEISILATHPKLIINVVVFGSEVDTFILERIK
jgi:hypothetical protein